MNFVPLEFQAGIVRDGTSYANTGGWYDCNLVRFHLGKPQTMGGWARSAEQQFLGTCRALHVWFDLNSDRRLAIGTHRKYYVEAGSILYDITPIEKTTTPATPFSATEGEELLTVTDLGHGAVPGTFIIIRNAVGLGGDITAPMLNKEHEIEEVIDSDTYLIRLPVPATAADTGDGGASVEIEYQTNPGLDSVVGGTGWGAPPWGVLGWGLGGDFFVEGQLRQWSQDNFGEDLILNVRNGGIYYWQNFEGFINRAVPLSQRPGADPETPVVASQVLVSDRDRHVIAFGCNPLGSTDQDPMLIRFSDQENALDWTPKPTNTAGDLRIGSGSRILKAIETKREILVWTDASIYSMRFVGPPFTFGIEQVSKTSTVIGYNCFAEAEDSIYWMGNKAFFTYTGQVQELQCPVREYVFNDFNYDQADKVYAGTNSEHGEVIWFYPSSDSDENNRYVIYNYQQQIWYYGALNRTAWIDCCPEPFPVAASTDNYLYYHDFGLNDGSTSPPSPLPCFIESAPLELQQGNRFVLVDRVLPDVTFYESTPSQGAGVPPQVTMTLTAQDFPGAALGNTVLAPAVRSAVVPVEQFTNQVHVRLRSRSVRLRVESNQTNTRWQLGTPRISLRADGRR